MIGFISPDGKLTQCDSFRHLDCAEMICKKRYGFELDGVKSEKFLLDANWIELREDEVVFEFTTNSTELKTLTPRQILQVYKAINDAETWKQRKSLLALLDQNSKCSDAMLTTM